MGTVWGPLDEPEVRAPDTGAPSFFTCARAVLARCGLVPYLVLATAAGLSFGGAMLVLPVFAGMALLAVLFMRVGVMERALEPLPLGLLLAIGAAPFAAFELVDFALSVAGLEAPGAPLLSSAIAGWVALPLLSVPGHLVIGGEGLSHGLGRALAGADERRMRYGTVAVALTGLAFGALLVAPHAALASDFNVLMVSASLWQGSRISFEFAPLILAALPVALVVPALSVILAEHDDALLSRPVGGAARSPLVMTVPLLVAIGLSIAALAHVPACPTERLAGRSAIPSLPRGVTVSVPSAWVPVTLTNDRAYEVRSATRTYTVRGPRGGRTVGTIAGAKGRTGLVFSGEHLTVVWIDAEGNRVDGDDVISRILSRVDGIDAALFAALLLGALLIHLLRPGRLHRLTRPSRVLVPGTLTVDPDAVPSQRGARTYLNGTGLFVADDGGAVLSLDEHTLLLGLTTLPEDGTKVTLATPTRPPSLALRAGTMPIPKDAVLVGDREPVDAVLSTAMQRSAALPLLLMSALATALCVHLVFALG
jgi:hypothetical protein